MKLNTRCHNNNGCSKPIFITNFKINVDSRPGEDEYAKFKMYQWHDKILNILYAVFINTIYLINRKP